MKQGTDEFHLLPRVGEANDLEIWLLDIIKF